MWHHSIVCPAKCADVLLNCYTTAVSVTHRPNPDKSNKLTHNIVNDIYFQLKTDITQISFLHWQKMQIKIHTLLLYHGSVLGPTHDGGSFPVFESILMTMIY